MFIQIVNLTNLVYQHKSESEIIISKSDQIFDNLRNISAYKKVNLSETYFISDSTPK